MATQEDNATLHEDTDIFVVVKSYTAKNSDEISLKKGDFVEVLDTQDTQAAKKIKLDPELDVASLETHGLLDSSAAKHKLAVKPKRTHKDSRQSSLNTGARWLVKLIQTDKESKEGWIPSGILRLADESAISGDPPADTIYRRQAVVRELIDTEEEFCRDLQSVLEKYYYPVAKGTKSELNRMKPPKCIRDNHDLIFGNLKQIADFHTNVLMEGVKYYASEPPMLGRVFLRLERDFDKHVAYCRDEPIAQHFLEDNLEATNYFEDLSQRLCDDKTLSEHLKLPIQRINDYQLLIKELVKYTCWLQEDANYLQRALELMLSVPHRAIDDKFTSNIEGYRGSIYKLGRLLAHDWYTVTKTNPPVKKERYLFLFKARILVCKVKRISEDRSVFQLKDIIKLPEVEVHDFPDDSRSFELHHTGELGYPLTLTAHRDLVKLYWLDEIRQYSSDLIALEEHAADDLQIDEYTTESLNYLPPKLKVTFDTSTEQTTTTDFTLQSPTSESYKTAAEGDISISEELETTLQETILSEARTVLVQAKRAVVIPVDEPLQAISCVGTTEKISDENNQPYTSVIEKNESITEHTQQHTKEIHNKSKSEIEVKTTEPTSKIVLEEIKDTITKEEDKIKEEKNIENNLKLSEIQEKSKILEKDETVIHLSRSQKEEINNKTKISKNKKSLDNTSTETLENLEETKPLNKTNNIKEEKSVENNSKEKSTEEKPKDLDTTQINEKEINDFKPITELKSIDNTSEEILENLKIKENNNVKVTQKELTVQSNSELIKTTEVLLNIKQEADLQSNNLLNTITENKTEKVVLENNTSVSSEKKSKNNSIEEGQKVLPIESNSNTSAVQNNNNDLKTKFKVDTIPTVDDKSQEIQPIKNTTVELKNTKVSDIKEDFSINVHKESELLSEEKTELPIQINKTELPIEINKTELPIEINKTKLPIEINKTELPIEINKTEIPPIQPVEQIKQFVSENRCTSATDTSIEPVVKEIVFDNNLSEIKSKSDSLTIKLNENKLELNTQINENKNVNQSNNIVNEPLKSDELLTDTTNKSNDTELDSDLKEQFISIIKKKKVETQSVEKSLQTEKNQPLTILKPEISNPQSTISSETQNLEFDNKRKDSVKSLSNQIDKEQILDKPVPKTSKTISKKPLKKTAASASNNTNNNLNSDINKGLTQLATKDQTSSNSLNALPLSNVNDQLPKNNEHLISKKHEQLNSDNIEIKNSETFTDTQNTSTVSSADQNKLQVKPTQEEESCKLQVQNNTKDPSAQKEPTNNMSKRTSLTSSSVRSEYHEEITTSYQSSSYGQQSVSSTITSSNEVSSIKIGGSQQNIDNDGTISITEITEVSSDSSGKPTFNKTIGSCNIEPGENAVFECAVRGGKTDKLIWLKDNRPLDDKLADRIKTTSSPKADAFTLQILHCLESDSGTYTAIASNAAGKAICTARLIVEKLSSEQKSEQEEIKEPIFVVQMKDTELLENTFLRFMIKVKGDPKPNVTFYKDDKEITSNNKRIKIVRELSEKGFYEMIIESAKPEDAGKYRCVAENEFGKISSNATLTVVDQKNIFGELEKKNTKEKPKPPANTGEKPKFMWQRDGVYFEPDERFKVLLNENQDSLALVFEHVKPEDAGLYTCVAQTQSGMVSCSAELTVQGAVAIKEPTKPKVMVYAQAVETSVNESAMLEIHVTGWPRPLVTWTHEGKPIETGGRYKYLYEDTEAMSLVIKGVTTDDSGKYEVTAKNDLGTDTSTIHLNVKAPPKITSKITTTTCLAGETLKMSNEVEGNPKPEVKFFKDGQEVKESDHIKLISEGKIYSISINSAKLTDSGSYSMSASNELAQTSQFWKAKVVCAPKIIKKMGESKICDQKEDITFQIEVESEPLPTAVWYKDDKEITSDTTTIKRTQDGSTYALRISGTVFTDSAKYKCVLTNEHGSSEDSIRLDVTSAPQVKQKMSNITVTEGDTNIELYVSAEGFPKPKAKWYLGDIEITEKKNQFSCSDDKDGNYKLVIKEAAHELTGNYICKLINDLGTTESNSTVTVNCKPRLKKKLENAIVDEGGKLTLQIEVESCPDPTVKWYKDGSEVSADARIKITRDSQRNENYNLTVDLVKYEDGGEYEVVVQNILGSVSCKNTVTVHTSPKITDSNFKDESVYESLRHTLYVKASGLPIPEAEWLFEGTPIKDSKTMKIIQEDLTYRLELTDIKKTYDGEYKCVLKNKLGQDSKSCKLNVLPESEFRKPRVIKSLSNLKVHKNEPVQMTTVIVGDPVPDIQWSHMLTQVKEDDIVSVSIECKEINDGLKECTCTLNIVNSRHKDTGEYLVSAKNKHGHCETEARLDVLLKPELKEMRDLACVPGEVANLSVVVHANPTATLTWSKDGSQITNCDSYVIETEPDKEKHKLTITRVTLADDGRYTITAKNDQGETTGFINLNAQTQTPNFITKLSDAIVNDYDSLTLHVRCDGLPKPTVKWFRDGKRLESNDQLDIRIKTEAQVTSDLNIKEFKAEHAGQYSCIAANVTGEDETHCRISLAQTPPSFRIKPDNLIEASENEPFEIKAIVSGSPKPTVAWFKDGLPISSDDPHIKTTISPDGTIKLHVDNASPADSGAYKLVVNNPNGEIACLCAVTVSQTPLKPKFIKPLQDVSIYAGEPLKLEASVSAFPPPKVEWFKDGVPIRPSSAINIINQPNGVIGIEIDKSKPDTAGVYTVTIANKLGETTGQAKVDVAPEKTKPEFGGLLQPMKVIEGFPAKMEVKALGNPKPSVKWSRNGIEIIPDGKHIKITEQPDGTLTLTIDKCTIHDGGPYEVQLSNENGTASSKAILTVSGATNDEAPEEKPVFLQPLHETVTDEAQELKLEAPFRGNPIPTVTWTKDGVPVEQNGRILLTCDGTRVGLVVDNANPSDSGTYNCKLTNPLGEDSSEAKAIVRKIFQPPNFIQKFTDLQQLPACDAKFLCRISGLPTPTVSWFKDGKPICESDKYHIKHDGEAYCLYVKNCTVEDNGKYSCTAKNKEGSANCEANLQVVNKIGNRERMEAPSFLKKIGDTELYEGMTAKFTACVTGYPEPEIEWLKDETKIFPSDRIRIERDNSGLLRLTIAGIDSYDLGKYTCRAVNSHGEDECHANLTFDTLESQLKQPLADLYKDLDTYKSTGAPVPLSDPPIISKMSDHHLTLFWKPSIPSGPRFPVTYQVEMLDMPNGDWRTLRSGIRSCTCSVPNLEPYKDYKFRVRVENKFGVSDPSPYAMTFRHKLQPETPSFPPYLPPDSTFSLDSSPYFPKDFDIERPLHGNLNQAPVFLRRENDHHYGTKNHNVHLFWFVYGYPKPIISYTFNGEPINMGGQYDCSYTRNGQASLFVNKMLDRDVGVYEAIAKNDHGEARQKVELAIAELPKFWKRLDEQFVMMRRPARLDAKVTGVPYPELKWFKDWQPLAASTRIKIQFIEPDIPILVVNDCIVKDEGLYSLTAHNVAGSVSSSAMIHLAENEYEYSQHNYVRPNAVKPKIRLYEDVYDLGDELGRGTQGVTYHVAERPTGRNYAAKVMHGRSQLKSFMVNELEIMGALNHRKLIRLHDAYEKDSSMVLITELASGGELVKDTLLKKSYYTESEIAGYIRQLLWGLEHMHEKNIGHFGLTIGDLLISHPGSTDLKIGDFGLAHRMPVGRLPPLYYGVPEYVSPETAKGEGVTLSTDMWTVGIITYILLSGISPFRGENDRETLNKIREGSWVFTDDWWINISTEAKDFIQKLIVYEPEKRLIIRDALRHPWLLRSDNIPENEYQISADKLRNYYNLYREWYDNASCRLWYRRNKLSTADEHPSKMVYPPGECYTPQATPERTPRVPGVWEQKIPDRPDLHYDIGVVTSESHYQNGPDTYLLQLRDTDFPVRLREYMKVASQRSQSFNQFNDYDWRTPIIHERRRFTDVMDEEIDDERRDRINKYGSADVYSLRRLKHEVGTRLDAYAEAEAMIESKQSGFLPFFREKQQIVPIVENQEAELVCFAVGGPTPVVQWFKNDTIIGEDHRIKIITDEDGRSILKFCPAMEFDVGLYKIVARNQVGQTFTRTRVVLGSAPDSPDPPIATQISDTEVLLSWRQPKHDGYSPVLCYSLEYKPVDEVDWNLCADNIDHEFYLIKNLTPEKHYVFRLAARNAIRWGDFSAPTAIIKTMPEGGTKIAMSRAMTYLQQLTDSGRQIKIEGNIKLDYDTEKNPIEWNTENNVTDQYNFISEINRGRFSLIVKAINKSTDSVVVAKLLENRLETASKIERELNAWRTLRHERIAILLAAYKKQDGPVAALISERLQGADVLTYLASKYEYSEQTVATIISQVLDGLQYLHWRGYAHLNIQPDNVVLTTVRSVQIKLVDLGSAQQVSKLGSELGDVDSHLEYTAPEILKNELAYPQTDLWSVGVLTYVLLSGTSPFHGVDVEETRQNILYVRYRFEHLYKELTQEAVRFIMLLFKRAPSKRPTADETHENRWFMPTDYMIKKRERAVFLGNRLKDYCDAYHMEKMEAAHAESLSTLSGTKGPLGRSNSIQEELSATP